MSFSMSFFKAVFEPVQKKIRFTFSSASSINLFLIRTAVKAACNSSFDVDNVYSFKGASLRFPSTNDICTKFSSVIFRKYTTHPKTPLEESENKCNSGVLFSKLKP